MKLRIAIPLIGVLAVGVIATGYLLWQQTAKLGEAESEIVTLEGNVSTLEGSVSTLEGTVSTQEGTISALEGTVSTLEGDVSTLEADLADSEATVSTLEADLATVQSEAATLQSQLSKAQTDYDSLAQTLASEEQQLSIAQETLEGLGITLSSSALCYDATLIDEPTATNPSWSQLRDFLTQDHTDRERYVLNEYDCSEFSRDVHNNAEAAGIRAALVHISFSNHDTGHALNAFLTSDYGLVYVDCTERDTIARVEAGEKYRAVKPHRVSRTNIRNDLWWDGLSTYYYISAGGQRQARASSITIYW